MSQRIRAGATLAVLALLAVAIALPIASADHAYSHRYVIWGRLVDADNNPVVGVTLDMAPNQYFSPEGACRGRTGSDLDTSAYGPTVYRPQTDDNGDFIFCFHTHKINRVEPGSAVIAIPEVPEFMPVTVNFNPEFRSQAIVLQLPNASAKASTTILDTTYTVLGRLWTPASGGDQFVENIRVLGDVVQQEPVKVTIRDAAGTVVGTVDAKTNDYGDFAVRVPVDKRLNDGTVEIVTAGMTLTGAVAPAGITSFFIEVPAGPNETLRNALWIGFWVILAGVVIGGGYWGIQRISSQRELDHLRETTTRKRSR